MDVLITVKGLYRAGGEGETLEFTTEGILETWNGTACVSYQETEETGLENVTTTFRLNEPGTITLSRSGAVQSSMTIEEGRRHLCHYSIGEGEMMVGVFGEAVTGRLDESGGDIFLRYTIDVNADLAACNEISISVRRKEKNHVSGDRCHS